MKAKQFRFRHFRVSSDRLAFKGFVVKNAGVIVNVDYTVTTPQLPVSGTLQQLIIKEEVDYSTLPSITFLASEIHKPTFEIVIDFATEIDFDNIQCVCGSDINNHFKNITLEYKTQTGVWSRFNYPTATPVFSKEAIGSGNSVYPDFVVSWNVNTLKGDVFKNPYPSTTAAGSVLWDFIFKSLNKISTGKHFVEISLTNSNRSTGNAYCVLIGIVEVETQYNAYSTTTGSKGYYAGFGSAGGFLRRTTGTAETVVVDAIGPGFPAGTNWPEQTVGFFVDFDTNKFKMVVNGVYSSAWFDIAKTKAGQEFFFYAQVRNMGVNAEYSINYPPKYTYSDLTPAWNIKHFMTPDGWKRNVAITCKKSTITRPKKRFIEWPWTLLNRGLLKVDTKYVASSPHYVWKIANYDETRWGYGYFKNSVFVDYPPKEPTRKRVLLFSINDNEMQQMTWSNALTGEFEFKNVRMKQPYLIITYDSDEDYNGVVVGPVYPTLMPKFEGIDVSTKY